MYARITLIYVKYTIFRSRRFKFYNRNLNCMLFKSVIIRAFRALYLNYLKVRDANYSIAVLLRVRVVVNTRGKCILLIVTRQRVLINTQIVSWKFESVCNMCR